VKHLKDVDFVTNDMNKVDEAHFFLHYDKYTLRPFWEQALSTVKTHLGPNIHLGSLLSIFRKEYYALIKELSILYSTDMQAKEEAVKQTQCKKLEQEVCNRKDAFKAQLKRRSQSEKGDYIVDYIQALVRKPINGSLWVARSVALHSIVAIE
jgi:hypothetical protein